HPRTASMCHSCRALCFRTLYVANLLRWAYCSAGMVSNPLPLNTAKQLCDEKRKGFRRMVEGGVRLVVDFSLGDISREPNLRFKYIVQVYSLTNAPPCRCSTSI
ncbi:hypothetical protein FB451DRAFT_1242116, partial [Mycena latifolia]